MGQQRVWLEKDVPKPAKDGLVYMWLFDEGVAGHQFSTFYDTTNYWMDEFKTNFFQDTFKGNFEYVEGVSGSGCKFDGFTTRIIRTAIKVPDLSTAFSIEGWIAPQSTRQAAIVSQEKEYQKGFIFGLFNGRLGIQMAIGDKWIECLSDMEVPLRTWSHITMTFQQNQKINLYLNGRNVGSLDIEGRMTAARTEDLLIGMTKRKDLSEVYQIQARSRGFFISGFSVGQTPLSTERKPVYINMAFDGLLDELKLYNETLSAKDVRELSNEYKPKVEKPLYRRRFPTGSDVSNPRFGASYGRLPYYDEYENTLRIGDYSDILVRFDLLPIKLMFAHSNTYIPIWVTENNKLMGDQSVEINGINGWYEVMMDKQNRYSHVRLLENHDARVVVHWRYALCDRFYEIARPDEMTGWGDWADEYFTIYPDGVTVRHWVYWTSMFGKMYLQFQETILRRQPDELPEDNLELEALTLANMEGKTYTYSWAEGLPPYFPKPEGANIQLVNMKSQYRPFIIFEPGSRIDKYIWGFRRGGSSHFPGGPLASGIPVISKGDRKNSYVAVALYGMTENPIKNLLPLAKSWIFPPVVELINSGFRFNGYDRNQKAYVFTNDNLDASTFQFTLLPDNNSPVVNPAFVIKNCDWSNVELEINGEKINRGDGFRLGHTNTFEGKNLVIWLEYTSITPIKILLYKVI